MVERNAQVRVLQAQVDMLQNSHSALSIELNNLYQKYWEGKIQGIS